MNSASDSLTRSHNPEPRQNQLAHHIQPSHSVRRQHSKFEQRDSTAYSRHTLIITTAPSRSFHSQIHGGHPCAIETRICNRQPTARSSTLILDTASTEYLKIATQLDQHTRANCSITAAPIARVIATDTQLHLITTHSPRPDMDSIILATMKTKDQTPNCPLFRLPPELRNRIYELVFEVSSASIIRVTDTFSPSGHDATDAITSARKAAAAPPSAALVRSCQRIHGESKVFFDEASKRYWKNEFLFELPIDLPHHLTFERFIKPAPTQRIENLSVMVSSEDGITTKVRLHRRGTAWSVTNEQPLFEDLGPLTGSNGIWRIRYAALST